MKKPKPVPAFKTEAEERKFWETHDSTNYFDWSNAKRTGLPKLKPSADGNVMLDETKITRAMEWASSQTSLIEDDYYNAYSDLLDFFKKLDLKNEQNVVGAAHAVYGWMPTILKKETNAKELVAFTSDLRKNRERSNQRKFALDQLRQRLHITKAINGSTVGTSKFLHFVEPEIFPIWDSNIALAFEVSSKINDPDTYLAYCEAVHRYLDKNPELKWPSELPDGISDIRKMEFCLYAYGKFRKSHR
jgi:CopG antitoxin of type II toxin-antitoxin system